MKKTGENRREAENTSRGGFGKGNPGDSRNFYRMCKTIHKGYQEQQAEGTDEGT